jgi:hypothetical protein
MTEPVIVMWKLESVVSGVAIGNVIPFVRK